MKLLLTSDASGVGGEGEREVRGVSKPRSELLG